MAQKIIVDSNIEGMRLDKALSTVLPQSRTQIESFIKDGKITVNNKVVKGSYKLVLNDEILIEEVEEKQLNLAKENLHLDIVYEDDDVAIVNKPSGMVVHPAAGNEEHTLVNGLLYQMDIKASINGVFRPGIVHRIDKDTSGLLMIAKNDKAMESLSNQLKEHTCHRVYVGLVYGVIGENEGKIIAPIGRSISDRKKMTVTSSGKDAVTHFRVLQRYLDNTLCEFKLETGRTHQIRVHMKYIGHPLVGDPQYGPRHVIGNNGQFLHAKTIGFIHPTTGKYMEFTSELPQYFTDYLQTLKKREE
jgi:23S rRNA pseudouridine1911/1915/1917 synthase